MSIARFSAIGLVAVLCLIGAGLAQDLEPYEETLEGTLVKFDMVPVPGGAYEFANPDTEETESLEIGPFWIGRTEVSWDEYDVFLLMLDYPEEERTVSAHGSSDEADEEALPPDGVSRPSKPYAAPDMGWGHQGYAAIHISYHAAATYCEWLSKKTGKHYRLATEAEWEYACRACELPAGPIEDADKLVEMAWYWDTSEEQAHELGTKAANAWGIHDMLGNAAEWVHGEGRKHFVRGGSWEDEAEDVHPAARKKQDRSWQMSDPQIPKSKWWLADGPFIGFRVVCDPNPPAAEGADAAE